MFQIKQTLTHSNPLHERSSKDCQLNAFHLVIIFSFTKMPKVFSLWNFHRHELFSCNLCLPSKCQNENRIEARNCYYNFHTSPIWLFILRNKMLTQINSECCWLIVFPLICKRNQQICTQKNNFREVGVNFPSLFLVVFLNLWIKHDGWWLSWNAMKDTNIDYYEQNEPINCSTKTEICEQHHRRLDGFFFIVSVSSST